MGHSGIISLCVRVLLSVSLSLSLSLCVCVRWPFKPCFTHRNRVSCVCDREKDVNIFLSPSNQCTTVSRSNCQRQ